MALQHHDMAERSMLARIPSAERRYERFLEMDAFDINRVPLRCIASYLGIRIETLSRIRNKTVSRKGALVEQF